LPHYPTYRMRAISRFPPPDSHVSLSAVLEPGTNPQLATPPRPTTGQSNTPQNRGAPHPKPIPTDTPRHYDPPLLRSEPLTSLAGRPRHPNRCEFATRHAASKALTRFNHQPTPPIEHDTRPSRLESTQSATPPAPATGERKPNRLRKFFPPQAPASVPMRRSTSKAPNRPGQRCDVQNRQIFPPQAPGFASMPRSPPKTPHRPRQRANAENRQHCAPKPCFSTCASTCQMTTSLNKGSTNIVLFSQGANGQR
jgi:hypothetical protein